MKLTSLVTNITDEVASSDNVFNWAMGEYVLTCQAFLATYDYIKEYCDVSIDDEVLISLDNNLEDMYYMAYIPSEIEELCRFLDSLQLELALTEASPYHAHTACHITCILFSRDKECSLYPT